MVAERTGTQSLATILATNVLAECAGVLEFAKPAKSCGSSLRRLSAPEALVIVSFSASALPCGHLCLRVAGG